MPASSEREKEFNLVKGLLDRFEKHPVVEVSSSPEIPAEVKSYIEKVETASEANTPTVISGKTGTAITTPPKPVIILPLTASQYASAKKASVFYSIRWLAAWCLRLFKIYGQRASFRQEPGL